jgi:hypothetical protein
MNVAILYGQVAVDAGQAEQDVLVQVETVGGPDALKRLVNACHLKGDH